MLTIFAPTNLLRLGQVKPGEKVGFRAVSLEAARITK
jgi:allophanate hydrolase subunit 2